MPTYFYTTVLTGPGVVNVIFSALLFANMRATWIASSWRPASEEAALPPRLNETWGDKLADQLPMWLWPKMEIPYYIFSAAYILLVAVAWWNLHHR